jgi:hypothetical protein
VSNRLRNVNIWELCRIENVCNWVSLRRKERDEHITRMFDNRVVKIVRDMIPAGNRRPGQPCKRWRDDITLM